MALNKKEISQHLFSQELKKCNRCGLIKSIRGFSKGRAGFNGLSGQCKDCIGGNRRKIAVAKREYDAEMIAVGLKKCSSCLSVKNTSDYYKDKRRKGRHCAICKNCHNSRAIAKWKKSDIYKKNLIKSNNKTMLGASGKKKCTICNTIKSFSSFSALKRSTDGLGSWCKSCKKEAADKYTEQNPNKCKEWAEANPEHVKFMSKEHYKKNRSHIKERVKSYMSTGIGREKRKEYINTSKYKAIQRVSQHKRRLAKSYPQTKNALSNTEWADLQELYGHKCAYCQRTGKMELEHIKPLSKGGAHEWDNITTSCRSCNGSKYVSIIGKEWHPINPSPEFIELHGHLLKGTNK